MKELRVCYMNDSFPPIIDGVSNAVVNYASIIEKEWGHSLVVAPSYPDADDSSYPFPIVRYPSIDIRKQTTGYMAGIPFSPEFSFKLVQHKINIIHAHCPMMSALLARSLRKRMNVPMIMTYHTKYDIDIANVLHNKALQISGIKSIVTNTQAFDEVWVVSEGAGENLKSLGFQGDYIVMPNGVDFDRKRADGDFVREETKNYDLPEGVPVFLFVGRMMWYKGIRIILDAMKKLQDRKLDFRMVMIGSGGDEAAIRMYSKSLGLQKKVFFTGAIAERERIRCWYTRADLFLFPSTFDSNGLVVREAAACNLASVLVEDSCAAEGVTDGKNAFLIRENAESLAQLLQSILPHPEKIREAGIHAGEDLYISWEEAVSRAAQRYQIVLDLYKSGAYKEHDGISDSLLATSGDLMFTLSRISRATALRKSNAGSYRRNRVNSRKISRRQKGSKKNRRVRNAGRPL